MTDPIGEPFVDDVRLAKAERAVRGRVPYLPQTAQFATYIQPKTWANVRGLDREVPPTAVFVIVAPNPKHEGFDVVQQGSELFAQWEMRDKAYKRYAAMEDPLVPLFTQVARQLASTLRNLKAMN